MRDNINFWGFVMRRQLLLFMVVTLFLSALLTGCGLMVTNDEAKGENKEEKSSNEEEQGKEAEEAIEAKSAQSTGVQPWYKWDDFYFNTDIPRHQRGGIWFHTKEEHAGTIDDKYKWDEVDVLEIQISEKAYYGYKIVPVSFELQKNNTAEITVQLKPGTWANNDKNAEPARVFIRLNRGTINKDTKYIIKTEDGEILNTN